MPRQSRHRKAPAPSTPDHKPAKEKPFFQPFAAAKEQLQRATPPAPAPPPVAKAPPPPPPKDDATLFAEAMAGVNRVGRDERVREHVAPEPVVPERANADQEALLELAEFVSGQGDFDISDTDEHVEGAAEGLDPRILRKLRRGEYAVAGHVDLHGLVRDEARAALTHFIAAARLAGKRCVIVVHGRGLHSKDQLPVLKEAVVAWLGRSGLRKQVLAFCTARPYDGGAGALYVLLRR